MQRFDENVLEAMDLGSDVQRRSSTDDSIGLLLVFFFFVVTHSRSKHVIVHSKLYRLGLSALMSCAFCNKGVNLANCLGAGVLLTREAWWIY
jgi:hypothetical protein